MDTNSYTHDPPQVGLGGCVLTVSKVPSPQDHITIKVASVSSISVVRGNVLYSGAYFACCKFFHINTTPDISSDGCTGRDRCLTLACFSPKTHNLSSKSVISETGHGSFKGYEQAEDQHLCSL